MTALELQLIDIHAHVNFAAFKGDRKEVISRAREEGIGIINVGTQFNTSKQAAELANTHDNCWAIVGVHPIHTQKNFHDKEELGEEGGISFNSKGETVDKEAYGELITQSERVVGVGETGIDYVHNDHDSKDTQVAQFEAQIELAIEHDLPLMLHVRPSEGTMDAYKDTLEVLRSYKQDAGDKLRGDAHFFAGDTDIARQFLDLGFDVSFTGVLTFASGFQEVAKYVPIDRVHVETDCPYVAPVPYRGKRNEPSYVRYTAEKLADLHDKPNEELFEKLRNNANRLFGG